MRFLLDTQILLWAAADTGGSNGGLLSTAATKLIDDADNDLIFSVASLWEVTIKHGLGRGDFRIDPRLLRRGLRDNGYMELAITGEHAVAVGSLPPLHKDPFDRLLVAQALAEGITLVTSDREVARYPGAILHV